MNRSINHQDRSGAAGMPLAVFTDGRYHCPVDMRHDPYGYQAAENTLAARPNARVEVLTVCLYHPTIPAVDCTDCVPLED